MDVEQNIKNALTRTLAELGVSDAAPAIEFPAELAHGDFSTNAALVYGKKTGKNPRAFADDIAAKLGTIEGVSKIEVAGPGFINFYLARKQFSQCVDAILAAGKEWGKNEHVKDYSFALEYGSPNLFKPLHIGNLMSTIIGEALARLIEASGGTVKRINYPSDIGLTVAKGVWGIIKKGYDPKNIDDLGKAYRDGNSAYEEDATAKTEIEEMNKKLYAGDAELTKIRTAGIATSKKHLDAMCHSLGTKFDKEIFESEMGSRGAELVKARPEIFESSDGAMIFRGEKYGLHTRVFLNSQGLPTYEAKDLALAGMKREWCPSSFYVTVTANEQNEYFRVIFKTIELVFPELKGKLMHVGYGFLTLTTGKMSSRKGNVITGESLLEDLRSRALAKMKTRTFENDARRHAVADAVAVAAIKYSVLKQGRDKNVIFDPEKSLSFEGDSGPYLQYAHTRALSVIAKASAHGEREAPTVVVHFERLLPRFPSIVFRAAKEYEPHHITTYLTELAGAFNAWYASERIIGAEHESYYVALVEAFAQTMQNGLYLLGIDTPEQM